MTAVMRAAAALALAVGAFALGGCAAPASPQAMQVSAAPKLAKQHPANVSVTTSGGAETSGLGSSNISNADLKAAIEKSIQASGLFKDVVQGSAGQYQLNVAVTQVDKPIFGSSFTVTLETAWSLVRASDKKVVWRKAISGAHTATMSDAFAGVKRLQLALEGAVRANIEKGLVELSGVTLDGAAQTAAAAPS